MAGPRPMPSKSGRRLALPSEAIRHRIGAGRDQACPFTSVASDAGDAGSRGCVFGNPIAIRQAAVAACCRAGTDARAKRRRRRARQILTARPAQAADGTGVAQIGGQCRRPRSDQRPPVRQPRLANGRAGHPRLAATPAPAARRSRNATSIACAASLSLVPGIGLHLAAVRRSAPALHQGRGNPGRTRGERCARRGQCARRRALQPKGLRRSLWFIQCGRLHLSADRRSAPDLREVMTRANHCRCVPAKAGTHTPSSSAIDCGDMGPGSRFPRSDPGSPWPRDAPRNFNRSPRSGSTCRRASGRRRR